MADAERPQPAVTTSLHVEVHPGRGPAMLLVHGLLAGRSMWSANLESLQAVCRPVVVELLGHGRSPSPAEPDAYDPAAYVEYFEAVRRHIGADRWVVCGHSLGAALTLRYALDRPERVLGHVFMNSNSALAGDGWRERVAPYLEREADRMESEGRSAIDAHPLNPSRSRRLPPLIKEALAADAALHDPGGVARTLRHTVPASSCRSRVHEHRPSALLVVGEREDSFREPRAFAESVLGERLTVVGVDAGHPVPIEAAGPFNAAVTRFVRGL